VLKYVQRFIRLNAKAYVAPSLSLSTMVSIAISICPCGVWKISIFILK